MPVLDSLPYLDPEPLGDDVRRARKLIQSEAALSEAPHPSLQPVAESFLTAALEEEVNKKAEGHTLDAIDLSRYTDIFDEDGNIDLNKGKVALAYARSRVENLSLQAQYGKNQWLISNDQLEQTLKRLELELENSNQELEQINNDRQKNQLDSKTTLEYLQTRWQEGVRNVIEVNVACLKLEQQLRSTYDA
uniref:ARAD1D13420p n=1 Tax=Blastobotrys adeninivorans TaxID=409370 RepID=A0A060TF68_BLAAD